MRLEKEQIHWFGIRIWPTTPALDPYEILPGCLVILRLRGLLGHIHIKPTNYSI